MNEQNNYERSDLFEIEDQTKSIRKTFNRCGFAAFGLIALTAVTSLLLGSYLENASEAIISIYNNYLLIFNELLIGAAVALGALLLIGVPRYAPARTSPNPKLFLLLLCISIPVVSIGNTAGTMLTTMWDMLTGNETGNQLTELLTQLPPWQTALCAGILAPILEELFFRKLLIDRMRRHGDAVAIFVSALLFGLFHQNFSQFFYTFGLGLLLGYLYCRTGSYMAVTLYHVIFNFVMGVIPSFFLGKIMNMLNEIPNFEVSDAMLKALFSLFAENAVPIIFYLIHTTVIGALNVVGVILFILNVKKTKLEGDGTSLSLGARLKAAVSTPGMISAFVLLAILMISSLFSA